MINVIDRLADVFKNALNMLQDEIEENKESCHTENDIECLVDDWNVIVDGYLLGENEEGE